MSVGCLYCDRKLFIAHSSRGSWMLVLENVRYEYQNEWFEVCLTIPQGAIVSLMGPSGAGKSTLLSLVAGFIRAEQVEMWVLQASHFWQRTLSAPILNVVPRAQLVCHLTVRENIALGLNPSLKLTAQQKNKLILQQNRWGRGVHESSASKSFWWSASESGSRSMFCSVASHLVAWWTVFSVGSSVTRGDAQLSQTLSNRAQHYRGDGDSPSEWC